MSDRKVFTDSVTPLPDQPGVTPRGLLIQAASPENLDEMMTILFSLEIPADALAQLEEKVANGEVVTPQELNKVYAPNPADRKSLVAWLKQQGFEITEVSKDGTSVYATAPVRQIEKSLEVNFTRVTKDGITYTAAKNTPSLPADVGRGVNAIVGLQPFRQAYKNFRIYVPPTSSRMPISAPMNAASNGAARSRHDNSDGVKARGALTPSPAIQNAPPYLVPEVLKAYNADGLAVTGKGQTIAILIDTFPATADLKAFWKRHKLPITMKQIRKINVTRVHLPVAVGEETLDTEWTSGIAPGANVRIYASGSLAFVDLDRALDRIIADVSRLPGMRQLSISLGLGEMYMGGPMGEVATQHQKFLRLAAAGVNVFVSSGDAGSNPDDTGHGSSGPTQAEYEASDSAVIGVGGTTLNLSSGGSVAGETAWVGSGGGKSIFFRRPSWQKGPGVPVGQERLVPDVCLAADPQTGAYLIFQGQVIQIGGTSWSAPVWAGFCALINEARQNAGKPALPYLNPLIYPLMATDCFRDIKSGSNGAFKAGAGYDLVTGIGAPNVKELIMALT